MINNKLSLPNATIEIFNNWIGVHTVKVNDLIVSKKFSYADCNLPFDLIENGEEINYMLIVKIGSKDMLLKTNEILVDLLRENTKIKEDVLLVFGTDTKKSTNKEKVEGLKLLKEFQISAAIESFKKALEIDRHDPEIHFSLACCYSNQEMTEEGLKSLKLAIENNLLDLDSLLKHDLLAYLRLQDGFKELIDQNTTE